ncbi:MAG: ExbD/TolR family protein [Kiritimatiellia bacterium]|nr:biopolymer transporter ExbD [Lentisphaerota bacterium]
MAKKESKWSADEDPPCSIAMGPMIDCTFLLLMYFVSVSTLDSERISKDVVLPQAKDAVLEQDESGRFIVDIEWDAGQRQAVFKAGPYVLWDARDLVPMIDSANRGAAAKNFRVVIRADWRVPYEFTQQVMAAVAMAKVPNLMFSTLDREVPVDI